MFVAIVNHKRNAQAIDLRRRFGSLVPVCLLDSGSPLSDAEREHFDECLPNVYYSGLLNRSAEIVASRPADEPVLLICSDVEVEDPALLLDHMGSAFADPDVMVWAPSATVQSFGHMHPHGSGGLRRVSFTDGFCFAARRFMFNEVCPIDVTVNRLGWGPDVQFGYLAATRGGYCVVDDRIEVTHPDGAGYDSREAMRQYIKWRRGLPWPARIFHAYSREDRYLQGFPSRSLRLITIALHQLWRWLPTERRSSAIKPRT